MIVADASWVIALMDAQDQHHAGALALVETLTARPLIHAVTLAECLVAPARAGQHRDAARELRSAFEIVHTDDDSAMRWAHLRATEALRLPDAVVLDTALISRSPSIATFDTRLRDAAGRLGVGVVP